MSRAYAKEICLLDKIQIVASQHYLSTLKAHKLNTVIPTEVFCMKGTSLHSNNPNGQSSAMSCRKKRNKTIFSGGEKTASQSIQGEIEVLK